MDIEEQTSECYICTDPTEERSPCTCKAPVHMKCLLQWVKKNDNMGINCSICHTQLEGIELPERPENTPTHHGNILRPYRRDLIWLSYGWSFTRFIFFMTCGYIGKFMFAYAFEPAWLGVDEYWSPFDLIFLVCASTVATSWCVCFKLGIKLHTYIRRSDSTQYEEFGDSDSDSDTPV